MANNAVTNLLIPLMAVKNLEIPLLAITNGSSDPVWVTVPCITRSRYGHKEVLRLPMDSESADTVGKWVRFHRVQAIIVAPICLALALAAFATTLYGESGSSVTRIVPVLLIAAASGILWWSNTYTERLTIVQHPKLVRGRGIVIPNVPVAVAQEWLHRNPAIEATLDEPPPKRRPHVALGVVVGVSVLGSAAFIAATIGWMAVAGLMSLLMLAAGVAFLAGLLRRFN